MLCKSVLDYVHCAIELFLKGISLLVKFQLEHGKFRSYFRLNFNEIILLDINVINCLCIPSRVSKLMYLVNHILQVFLDTQEPQLFTFVCLVVAKDIRVCYSTVCIFYEIKCIKEESEIVNFVILVHFENVLNLS